MAEAFPTLFSPVTLGRVTLRNRIAMAPLTRQMADADGTPTDEMVAYYARRARGGLGLIVTEGTYEQDAFQSRAYLSQPGIANAAHVAGWKKVCDAVHENGAKIVIQLMHGGRVCDPRTLGGEPPVSASATQSGGGRFTRTMTTKRRSATFRATGRRSRSARRVNCRLPNCTPLRTGSPQGRSGRSRRGRTGSRCMGPTAISSGSSSRRKSTCGRTSSAAAPRTTCASPS
ncbi:hypothetical protein HYN69_10440 [Gemmobacter aquarius]|uniref:NADH:flavin oxidoreductase/NADH oxidase N-terminal domain-containing protein n=1 Tax=Paragemmobacter aquarius TaxID=2169400 RepID=A0A2S0UM36_9RHOB|nr:hypothetical protein HYN69_10440 [Gemmobacter aquarius]